MNGLPDAPVLVVVVNNGADWQHVTNDHWYRIPVKRAPREVAASFLAFYLTAAFGPEGRLICAYAPVKQVRIMTRRAILPDEGAHPRADDRYYVLELGPSIALMPPIISRKLRRITFIPTTLKRLLAAREVNDLWLHDGAEDLLWNYFPHAGLKARRQLTFVPDVLNDDSVPG